MNWVEFLVACDQIVSALVAVIAGAAGVLFAALAAIRRRPDIGASAGTRTASGR